MGLLKFLPWKNLPWPIHPESHILYCNLPSDSWSPQSLVPLPVVYVLASAGHQTASLHHPLPRHHGNDLENNQSNVLVRLSVPLLVVYVLASAGHQTASLHHPLPRHHGNDLENNQSNVLVRLSVPLPMVFVLASAGHQTTSPHHLLTYYHG